MWLSATISENTEDIYDDQITSVNFEPTEADDDEGEFSVHRSDGEGNPWETDRKPENALEAYAAPSVGIQATGHEAVED